MEARRAGAMQQVPAETWSAEVNQANKAALLAWVMETGIQLVQINGQRKYGGPPPGWTGSVPPPGSEVFIGKIPQDIYEDKLIPLFQRVGKLFEFRLMMTFSGLNRGFAYAKYANRHDAMKAITSLNNFELQAGQRIFVCRSTDKCELCIDGLSPSLKEGQVLPMLLELTAGVVRVALHPSPFRRNRQLAEVKYASHQAAALAKKTLVEGSLCLCGDDVEVDWLKPNVKQELHSASVSSCPALPPPKSPLEGPLGPAGWPLPPSVGSALDYLILQCEARRWGLPIFLMKCVCRNREGWLRFWYRVVIPKHPSPFSGFIWIKQDESELEEHEKAKNSVAFQLLKALGYPVV